MLVNVSLLQMVLYYGENVDNESYAYDSYMYSNFSVHRKKSTFLLCKAMMENITII